MTRGIDFFFLSYTAVIRSSLAKGSSRSNHFLTMAQLLQSVTTIIYLNITTVTHLACKENTVWIVLF